MEIVSKGGSLKFCLLAEGNADIYPKFVPTMEWGTAANSIRYAAGWVIMNDTNMPLQCNKENLLNPWFWLPMFSMALKKSSHLRSILKGISWRCVATLDTVLVVLFITCLLGSSIENALKIGTSEFLFKLLIFYLHERLWLYILGKQAITNKEILYKSLSWRLIATSTTFIISGIILRSLMK